MIHKPCPPHARRDAILAALEDEPGLGFRGLSRKTGIALGCLRHHVNMLIRSGQVSTVRHGNSERHFLGSYVRPKRFQEAVLRQWPIHYSAMVRYIQERPDARQKDIADAFPSIPRASVQHALKQLIGLRIIQARRSGRCLVHRAG